MRAMVMAAGLGTRLRPLTWEIPKPAVPVANRPVIEHILRGLRRHGISEVVANLHWFPETIRRPLGDGSGLGIDLSFSYEEELLNTAGGVRNIADTLTAGGGSFLVMAGDALTDIDFTALIEAHERLGGVATLAVKRVSNVDEYGVVITDSESRVQGFQEKPDPAEALSDLASCMIYAFTPEVFEYFPDDPTPDFALDVFPALLEHDVPFHVHPIDEYWNDVGSVDEYLQGNLDVVEGHVGVEPAGELIEGGADEESTARQDGGWELSGRVLLGEGATVGTGARIDGPAVVGPGVSVGANAIVKRSVLLPGAEVPAESMLVGSIAGRRGRLADS
jgi:mannose-1-phosphate guanylyltransferase/mannose-1-phosphate guanylyltransferase/phosphomannomutase